MGVFDVLGAAGSALTAQRLRMDVTASNIANAETTNTPKGGPYMRARVIFQPMRSGSASMQSGSAAGQRGEGLNGVEVRGIAEDPSPPRLVYDPNHPDADADGNVAYPNVNLVTEMTDMLSASRAYEANITVINVSKNMAQRAIDLGRI